MARISRHPPVAPGDSWCGFDFSLFPADGSPMGRPLWWDKHGQPMEVAGAKRCPQDLWDWRTGRKPLPDGLAALRVSSVH